MLRIKDAVAAMEKFAPLRLKEEYDNCGLLYGDPEAPLKGVTVSLDLTQAAVEDAVRFGSNLIVTHHPAIFQPIFSLDTGRPELAALASAVKRDLAVYAAHTNVDKAANGLSEAVLRLLGADVPEQPISLKELCSRVADTLGDRRASFVGDPDKPIRKAALITGAGGDGESLDAAVHAGADVFLSGEFKYHVIRFAKDAGYAIISFGHYESECFFRKLMASVLTESGIPCVHEAVSEENPYFTEGRV